MYGENDELYKNTAIEDKVFEKNTPLFTLMILSRQCSVLCVWITTETLHLSHRGKRKYAKNFVDAYFIDKISIPVWSLSKFIEFREATCFATDQEDLSFQKKITTMKKKIEWKWGQSLFPPVAAVCEVISLLIQNLLLKSSYHSLVTGLKNTFKEVIWRNSHGFKIHSRPRLHLNSTEEENFIELIVLQQYIWK